MFGILKGIGMYAAVGAVDLGLMALLIRTPLFKNEAIYYYRLLYLAAVIGVLTAALLTALSIIGKKRGWRRLRIAPLEVFSTAVVCTLGLALMITTASMPLDRSYTIYSIVNMADHEDKVYSREDIETQFIEGYVHGMQATQRRIEEQVSIGSIEEVDGGYRITEKGKQLVAVFKLYESVFPIQEKRLLYADET